MFQKEYKCNRPHARIKTQLYFKKFTKINTFAKPLISVKPCALAGIKELQAQLW